MIEQGNSSLNLEYREIQSFPSEKKLSDPSQGVYAREQLIWESYPSRSSKHQQPFQAPLKTDFKSPICRLKFLKRGIPFDRWSTQEDSPSLQDLEKSLSPNHRKSKDSFNSVFPVRVTGLSSIGKTIATSKVPNYEASPVESAPNKEHFRRMDEIIAYNISMIKASGLTRQLRK